MKQLKYRAEALATTMLFAAFKAMPLDMASAVGGFIGRSVGPYLRANKIAKRNLSMIYPKMSFAEQHKLIMGMWDNLGRVVAELPHLGDTLVARVKVSGMEHLPPQGKPTLFLSGHIGNWELTYPVVLRSGIPITLVYREANNPLVDKIICDIRATQSSGMIPKGPRGVVRLLRAIKNGQTLALLVDQKMNEGVPVPFFGRDAMTAPAIAELALRYDMPIIPGRIIRTKGCHFEGRIYPPLVIEKTGDQEADVKAILVQVNAILESWIREKPEQWFWVHKRWPNN